MANIRTQDLQQADDHTLLVELVKSQRQSSTRQMIASIFVVVIALIMAVAVAVIVPKAMSLMSDLQASLGQINTLVSEAQESVEKIDDMLVEIQPTVDSLGGAIENIDGMVGNLDSMITDNSENLKAAIEKMNGIDFDTLNQAIAELEATVQPFANFFGGFGR